MNIRISRFLLAVTAIVALIAAACTEQDNSKASNTLPTREAKAEIRKLRSSMEKIEPFFEPIRKPERYDWLASNIEPGQTFDEYLGSNPTKPTSARQKIYVLPLGTFNVSERKSIDAASSYLAAFFDLPVVNMPGQTFSPSAKNSRKNRSNGITQVRTGYILDDILRPMLPSDAAALIAFTSEDLYPNGSMNFVFGQASLEERVGVWSLARLDDNTDHRNFLLRTLKIAVHETGHMFSMAHCTKFECLMSGTNHLGETDRRPIDTCPECTAKICWFSEITMSDRYRKLIEFCKENGLTTEAKQFEAKLNSVEKN